MLTLDEKQTVLSETVAMPTEKDWGFGAGGEPAPDALIAEANAILVRALAMAKEGSITWGDLGANVYMPLFELSKENGGYDIMGSETCITIARFFALNHDPAMYDYMRFFIANQLT